jgi:hypothetical protein
MSDVFDLRALLKGWPYDVENAIRIVRGTDGREIMQVRTPVGVEQYELEGRPDGVHPHGVESALVFQLQRLERARTDGQEQSFKLTEEECAELFSEGVLYYFRYLHLFQVKDWKRVIRDTQRNIGLFDFVHRYAKRREDRMHLEQWRPYILRLNAAAAAMAEWDAVNHSQALRLIDEAIERIEALPEMEDETFKFERDRSLHALRDMAEQIESTRPLSELERLERALDQAVEDQEFERAAQLRDRIRALRPDEPEQR